MVSVLHIPAFRDKEVPWQPSRPGLKVAGAEQGHRGGCASKGYASLPDMGGDPISSV